MVSQTLILLVFVPSDYDNFFLMLVLFVAVVVVVATTTVTVLNVLSNSK